jgi:DNA-binding NarL/FixJ family response regulator
VIRVFVIARSEVVRAGLVSLLEQQSDSAIVVTGSGADPDAPLRGDADAILVDSGDARTDIASDGDDSGRLPVVLLADDPPLRLLQDSRGAIRAVLPRNATASEMAAAIVAVVNGLVALPARAWDDGSPRRAAPPLDGTVREELTSREMQVLRMLAEGHSNKTIAWQMQISEHTVKFHISSIFAKLHASTRTEAVAVGVRLGLIML